MSDYIIDYWDTLRTPGTVINLMARSWMFVGLHGRNIYYKLALGYYYPLGNNDPQFLMSGVHFFGVLWFYLFYGETNSMKFLIRRHCALLGAIIYNTASDYLTQHYINLSYAFSVLAHTTYCWAIKPKISTFDTFVGVSFTGYFYYTFHNNVRDETGHIFKLTGLIDGTLYSMSTLFFLFACCDRAYDTFKTTNQLKSKILACVHVLATIAIIMTTNAYYGHKGAQVFYAFSGFKNPVFSFGLYTISHFLVAIALCDVAIRTDFADDEREDEEVQEQGEQLAITSGRLSSEEPEESRRSVSTVREMSVELELAERSGSVSRVIPAPSTSGYRRYEGQVEEQEEEEAEEDEGGMMLRQRKRDPVASTIEQPSQWRQQLKRRRSN